MRTRGPHSSIFAAALAALVVPAAACGAAGNGAGSDGGPGDGRGTGAADARPGAADARPAPDGGPTQTGDLVFAIVGDTRPVNDDDTANYPTAIITKIWKDVDAHAPHPMFAISTGDYMFASPSHNEVTPQLDLYLGARANYSGTVYAAMGNHECTGATDSNCGSGNADGVTKNYSAYLARMVAPLGYSTPYYKVDLQGPGGAWTAKIVVIAANAWTSAQASWLDSALAEPTTYTFVVRHEDDLATTVPGVTPSKTIIAKHPLTLLIAGHTHTYAHYQGEKTVICGNGGAPLTSGGNYGYGIVSRRSDGALVFTEYDYNSNAATDSWAVKPDGLSTN